MRTFIISLPEARERQTSMQEVMDALGLEFEFFNAVDGRDFDVPNHPAHATIKRRLFFGRDLKGGEMGVLLSNRAIYQKIVDEDIEIALVLEDDARFNKDLPDVLDEIEHGPQDFDLIRFLSSDKVMSSKQYTKRTVINKYNLNRLMTTPGGAFAYVITQEGARKLLRKMERNYMPIDTLMGHCWRTGVDGYIIKPGLSFVELDVPQYIGEDRFNKGERAKGWTSLLFPITRGWFKFSEGVMKRLHYIYKRIHDKNGGRAHT